MARQCDFPFAVRLYDPRASWLDVELRLGDHTERIAASGVVAEDPLTGFVRLARLAASDRDDEEVLLLWTEPGGYWVSAVTTGPDVRVDRRPPVDMFTTCNYADHMKMIQIRNVPDDLHRQLKARAALAGMSLSDYLLAEIRRSMDKPTRAELIERVFERTRVELPEPAADAVRAERDAR